MYMALFEQHILSSNG